MQGWGGCVGGARKADRQTSLCHASAHPALSTPPPRLPLPERLQSPNSETAGAAFVTLMALMGDGAPSSSSDGTRGGADAAADATASVLMLDAHYGLPAAAATSGAVQQPACRLDCLPTNAQLLEALRANGYSPKSGGGGGGGGRQQGGAAAAVQQGEEQAEGLVVRLQPIKLVLRTAAAVCRYCRKVSGRRLLTGGLS